MDRFSDWLAPHLRALVALHDHAGHMTRAAEALRVPQSSMSRRIHALERELGLPLLVHDGRAVRLTPRAAELARAVREPLQQLDHAAEAAAGLGDADHGNVRFGFPLTMGTGIVPDLLGVFRLRYPGIRVELKQAHGDALEADLFAGTLDLAITIPAPARARHRILGAQRICVVVPEAHRLAHRQRVRLDELSDDTFIVPPPSYDLRRRTEAWCDEAGFEPQVGVEATEFATIRELIARGLGVALLPVADRPTPGTVECALAGNEYQRDIALSWAATTEAPVTKRLAAFLTEGFGAPAPGALRRGRSGPGMSAGGA